MENTIAAISTNNLGVGAINIVRMSGKEALQILSKVFSNKKIMDAKSHTIHYGFILDKEEIVDEVLVMIMRAHKTYTKEDVVEINCHGGYATTNKILELLLNNGAVLAEPGEFTKRAFENGRINLLEAESIADLIEAKTQMQSKMAISGLNGKSTKMISDLRDKMVSLLSNIEVNIDYPEYTDEVEITKENITPILIETKEMLERIIEESKNGELIKNGINVAIIGRPNVGKSSLLNALLEKDKAIVTDISGTTRDIVEGSIVYKGIVINLIDTAGIRETSDLVEQIGVSKSKEVMKDADITVLVLNSNEKLTSEDLKLIEETQDKKTIIFLNKKDLESKIEDIDGKIIKGSTKTKEGLDELKESILSTFNLLDIGTKDLTYLSNARQISLAKEALNRIIHVLEENEKDIPIDMLAIDIKAAWEFLGNIIGEYYEDELVDNIFSRFCLGK